MKERGMLISKNRGSASRLNYKERLSLLTEKKAPLASGSESTANGRTKDRRESPDSAEQSAVFASFAERHEVGYDDLRERDYAAAAEALHRCYHVRRSLECRFQKEMMKFTNLEQQ